MEHLDNNLFKYATSELSQDAFICWLASYALVDENGTFISDDIVLRDCARKMLIMFVPEFEGKEFKLVKIEQQTENVDVLLIVICDNKKYAIIVEDKTYTSEHGNQLKNYKDDIRTLFEKNNEVVEIRGVYYKTWYQSNLKNVFDAKYLVVLREDILKLMEPYYGKTNNNIFKDYYDYWNDTHMECLEYKKLPTYKWNSKQVYAFYDYLKRTFFDGKGICVGYGYVANPNGGFHGLWTELPGQDVFTVEGIESQLYLQIHAKVIEKTSCELMVTLRLNVRGGKNSNDNRFVRDKIVYGDSDWKYKLGEYNFVRPSRFGNGVTMTIGEYVKHTHEFESYKDFEKLICDVVYDFDRLLNHIKLTYRK